MTDPRAVLRERRDQALDDLLEVDEQLRAGELDAATGARLQALYRAEATAVLRRLDALDALDGAPSDAAGAPETARRGRRLGGITVTAAVIVLVAVLLPRFTGDRPAGGYVTGNMPAGAPPDPGSVTNEQLEEVVAANPDVIGMRLRLAHRYLDAGDWRAALEHYTQVLDRRDDPEALAHLGWVLFNGGEPDLAAQLLAASLERAPRDAEARWFLANVRLDGQDDPEGAVTLLEQLQRGIAGSDEETLQQVAAMLARARAAVGGS